MIDVTVYGFHWQDGWYFRRGGAGEVRVTRVQPGHEALEFSIPAKEWASIVAAVSVNGETSESYGNAREFHGKIPGEPWP